MKSDDQEDLSSDHKYASGTTEVSFQEDESETILAEEEVGEHQEILYNGEEVDVEDYEAMEVSELQEMDKLKLQKIRLEVYKLKLEALKLERELQLPISTFTVDLESVSGI